MNTIEDLRATLATRGDLRDDNLIGRSAEIAGRVRTAKRRRRAAIAGVAAAAVVATAVGVSLVERPDPENESLLAGQPVPEELVAKGYRWDYVSGIESPGGTNYLHIELPGAPVDRLVSWATASDDQRVAVSKWGAKPKTSTAPDFGDYVWLPAGEELEILVEADSQVALATFERQPEPIDGVSASGVSYRRHVGKMDLVDVVIGERGQNELSMELTLPEGRLGIADFCQASGADGTAKDPAIELRVNGEAWWASSCYGVDRQPVDASIDYATFQTPGLPVNPRQGYAPGETVTLTIRLVESLGGPLVTDDQGLIAFGVYEMVR